ncbi:MAG TPA: tRNA (N(6)-L-threonylcarbamoyladenosine(37)-C(2))-methylthiotransferase MtaB, partial [Tenuifilaceae bacterium]|nr:tRNA (N(6)-L-threonylcarbamoyladenosine(37)-C(2))-methylthiotransferase MtaB [Tenuifilaceae bacterium]
MQDKPKTVAFYTLGCKLNFSETSTLARQFQEMGFQRVSPSSDADVYVINTCSVTEHADKKCRQAIRKFAKRSPNAFIAVVGCYSQL